MIMGPALKTWLKVFLGAVATAAAAFLVDPANYVVFGSLATLFAAIGAILAGLLEKLVSPPPPPPVGRR
jgi:hypothetical protein